MQSVEFLAIGSFCKVQIFFHFANSRFFFISQIPDFFSFRKIQIFFISQNPDFFISQNPGFFFISQNPGFFSFTQSRFLFLHTIQIYRLVTSFSDIEHSPLECKLFLLSERSITSYVYLCLIFIIGSFGKIQIFY